MDADLARWLVSPGATEALAQAAAQPDPGSLAAATALRRNWTPGQASAVLTQAELRRRAVTKFGDAAARLFFTRDALEQATRADVARWRSERYRDAGATQVVDLGCGIGADALAFATAGLGVVAVEYDPATAVLAAANLGDACTVVCGDAVELADDLLAGGAAVFADPARRTASGRTRVAVTLGAPPGDVRSGGLLEGVPCEEQSGGVLPELGDGPAAQFRLGEDRGGLRRRPAAAQRCRSCQ